MGNLRNQGQSKVNKKDLIKMVNNLQMAVRVLQLGFQQMANNFQALDGDLGQSITMTKDLQYLALAMIEAGDFNKDDIDKAAEALKLKDYNEASSKEDEEKGYEVADVVAEDSVIVLTSTCKEDEASSIFRTKFKLDESGNPEAQEKLLGLKVGDKTEITLSGKVHEVEVLAIRSVPQDTGTEDAAPDLQVVQ